MAEKIEISLGKEEAERALDALIAKAKQLTEELRKAATALGTPVGSAGGGGTNAMFGGTRGVGGGAGSSAAGVQASATTGGNSGTPLPPGLSWTTMTPDIRASLISQGVFPPGYGGGGAPGGGGGGGGGAPMAAAGYGPPMGPSSPIGSPGVNNMLWQQGRSQARNAAFAAVGVGTIAAGLSMYASNTANGDYDPMAGAAIYGAAVGGTAGAQAGFLLSAKSGGLLTGAAAVAAGAGGASGAVLGSAGLQSLIAPMIRQRNAQLAMLSASARSGQDATSVGYQLGNLSDTVSFDGKTILQMAEIKHGIYTGRDIISAQQAGQTDATLSSALLAAGDDPTTAIRGTNSLASKYYMGAPGIAQMAAPVIAARNRFNRNDADLLLNFGPEAFGAAQDAYGKPDITSGQRRSYRNSQTDDYLAHKGGLQTRGSGTAAAIAFMGQMVDISALPGGSDSLAYAQSRGNYRDALYESYGQADAAGYGLASTKLAGRENRAALLPFAPANMLGLGIERLGINRKQISTVQGRLTNLRASGNLTEGEELELTGQIEGLRTQNAGVISRLAEGMEDRLPSLSAGRPAFGTRLSSMNLAAMNADLMGAPVRAWGAQGGRQLAFQKQFIASMGGNESDLSPRSQTQALNTDLGSVLGRLATVLEKLSANAPNPMRPSEMSGAAYASQQRADIGAGRVYGTSN